MLLYVSIFLKIFVRTAKRIHNETFKDKVWFSRAHLQVFLKSINFDSQRFFVNEEPSS